jgi:hypothetical protein
MPSEGSGTVRIADPEVPEELDPVFATLQTKAGRERRRQLRRGT